MKTPESRIEWSDALSVGVSQLDRDHQIIIDLINRLDRAETESDLTDVLNTLLAYTEYHFYREERVMEVCDYPELEAHRQEHVQLAEDVAELQRRHGEGDPGVTAHVLRDFVANWLAHHILLEDMAYKPYAIKCRETHGAAASFGELDLEDLEPGPGDGSKI